MVRVWYSGRHAARDGFRVRRADLVTPCCQRSPSAASSKCIRQDAAVPQLGVPKNRPNILSDEKCRVSAKHGACVNQAPEQGTFCQIVAGRGVAMDKTQRSLISDPGLHLGKVHSVSRARRGPPDQQAWTASHPRGPRSSPTMKNPCAAALVGGPYAGRSGPARIRRPDEAAVPNIRGSGQRLPSRTPLSFRY